MVCRAQLRTEEDAGRKRWCPRHWEAQAAHSEHIPLGMQARPNKIQGRSELLSHLPTHALLSPGPLRPRSPGIPLHPR